MVGNCTVEPIHFCLDFLQKQTLFTSFHLHTHSQHTPGHTHIHTQKQKISPLPFQTSSASPFLLSFAVAVPSPSSAPPGRLSILTLSVGSLSSPRLSPLQKAPCNHQTFKGGAGEGSEFCRRRLGSRRSKFDSRSVYTLLAAISTTQFLMKSFGIAFDVDGVILGGHSPIGGSPQALKRLYSSSGRLKIPYLFLTNGGGIPESRRASSLSELLGVNILPSQVVNGHSSFRTLLKRFENELIVATGKGEPAVVMSEYGFKKVLSLEEYASYFDGIDPVSQYKNWPAKQTSHRFPVESTPRFDVTSERVKAAFVVSDPVDWGRDIQVLCDILTSGGLPGERNGDQPHLYFAADDLEYQAAFPCERLGMGAFRVALESVFKRIHHRPLECTIFGKPNPFVFNNAESILKQLVKSSCDGDLLEDKTDVKSHVFKTLYMIGDNPLVDVKGARQAGHPWVSILTRTGVFKGKENHAEFPADLVVDTVEEAVDYILKRELNPES